MGTFDEFYFVGDATALVVCASGHEQRGGLQTKELDCTMTRFVVYGPVEPTMGFYVYEDIEPYHPKYSIEDGKLVTRSFSRPVENLSGTIGVYTYCPSCEPVYYEGDGIGWRGDIANMSPRCQWLLIIDCGKIVAVQPIGCETRDQARQKLRENGQVPIPDDDRAVKRELEIWRAGTP